MDFDKKTGRLIVLFMAINLVAAVLGFAAVVLFGPMLGLAVFTAAVILLPIGIQYAYLKNSRLEDKERS